MRSPVRLLLGAVLATVALATSVETSRAYLLYATSHIQGGASDFYRLHPNPELLGPIGFNRVGAIDTHPFTQELYACGERPGDGTPVLIRIDPHTGVGTEIGPTGIAGSISDIAFRPLDGKLFAHDADPDQHKLYTIDITTGVATLVGPTGAVGSGNGIDFAPDNSLYLIASNQLYKLNHNTGQAVSYGALTYQPSTPGTAAAIDMGGDGFLYVLMKHPGGGTGTTSLWFMVPNSNTVSLSFSFGTLAGFDGIAFQSRPFAYASSGQGGAASDLYRIDLTTGVPTLVGPIGFDGVGALDFFGVSEGNRDLFGVGRRPGTNDAVLITIDPLTGQGTEVGPTNIDPRIADLAELQTTGQLAGWQAINDPTQSLFDFNIETGAATLIGETGLTGSAGNGIAELPTSPAIYHADHASVHLIDPNNGSAFSTGALTYLPPINTFNARPPAMDFNWNGTLYSLIRETSGGDRVSLATIDLVPRNVKQIADTGNPGLEGLAVRTDLSPLAQVTAPNGAETYGIGTQQPITWNTFDDASVPLVNLSYTTGVELYASTSTPDGSVATLYKIDLTTGVATAVGPLGYSRVGAMAAHPMTGVLYATGEVGGVPILFQIDLQTGGGTQVGTTESPLIGDLSFRPSDNALFAFNVLSSDHTLQRLNLQIGNAKLVGSTGLFASGGNGMEFVGNTLYHSNAQNLHTLNTGTGVATVVAPMSFPAPVNPGDGRVAAMKLHPETGEMYVLVKTNTAPQPTYLGTLDVATGAVTIIGETGVRELDGMAFVPGPWIPIAFHEPNDGSYTWTVPNTPTTVARVRIEAGEYVVYVGRDISDQVFTIQDITGAPSPGAPALALLGTIAPNPSPGATAIQYSLSRAADVRLTVHDVLGRRVQTLIDGRIEAGTRVARWDGAEAGGTAAASGMYWVRLEVDGQVQTGRFTLLR